MCQRNCALLYVGELCSLFLTTNQSSRCHYLGPYSLRFIWKLVSVLELAFVLITYPELDYLSAMSEGCAI